MAVIAFLPALTATSHLGASQDFVRDELVTDAGDQVARGAEVYDRNCAVCHGDSGLGFGEAKLAFPADHRACTRCHKPSNPAVMSLEQVHSMGLDHNLFSLGDPPPLRGSGALAALPSAAALYHYTRAAMPRYRPGTMTDREFLDVTAFLLYVNHRIDDAESRDTVLTAEELGLGN